MKKLTQKQKDLLFIVSIYPGFNTTQLNKILGNRQSYCSHLVERLHRLVRRGLVRHEEVLGPRGYVKERKWFAGASLYKS